MLNLIVSLLILPLMATDTAKQVRFTPKDLPYAYDALAPQVSEETLRFHHDKHYVGYVNKLNELIVDTPYAEQPLEDIVVSADGAIFNNAAQMWNHEFFFDELSPKAQTRPTGALLKAIDENFGSFDQLKAQMEKAAAGLFGSGWVWLAEDKSGKLAIVSEQNAGNPLRYGMKPLMCFDVWEHAYYIDYRNRRADAVAALWDRIDWKVVEERYAKESWVPLRKGRRFPVWGTAFFRLRISCGGGFPGAADLFRRIYRIGNIIYFRHSPQKILAGKNWWKWQKVLPLFF